MTDNNKRIEKKMGTIRFLLISFVLFILADIIGQWFIATESNAPALLRVTIWVIALLLGASTHYGLRRIDSRIWKTISALLFYAAYIGLLWVFKFYYFDNAELIGYRISVSILPIFAFLIDVYVSRFIKWYGIKVKSLFKLKSIRDFRFLGAMILLFSVVVFIFMGGYRMSGKLNRAGVGLYQLITEGEINHNTDHREPVRQYDKIFNDLNDTQLAAAKKNGLKKNISAAEAETNKQLVKIEDCDYYTIEELTHSIPYLVPKAAKLVEDIGKAFQDSLFNRGYHSNHKITVTCVLRTEDNVKQ
ncbi:MAG: hypothetical protein J6Q97_04170, partial [Bacteroidaceae bacterium]|nr:hypothetical protein [Bacteroidaceae bacterium]